MKGPKKRQIQTDSIDEPKSKKLKILKKQNTKPQNASTEMLHKQKALDKLENIDMAMKVQKKKKKLLNSGKQNEKQLVKNEEEKMGSAIFENSKQAEETGTGEPQNIEKKDLDEEIFHEQKFINKVQNPGLTVKALQKKKKKKLMNKGKQNKQPIVRNEEENGDSSMSEDNKKSDENDESDEAEPQNNVGKKILNSGKAFNKVENSAMAEKVLKKRKKKKLLNSGKQNVTKLVKNEEEKMDSTISEDSDIAEEKTETGEDVSQNVENGNVGKEILHKGNAIKVDSSAMAGKGLKKKKKKKLLNSGKQNEKQLVKNEEKKMDSNVSVDSEKAEEETDTDKTEPQNVEKENLDNNKPKPKKNLTISGNKKDKKTDKMQKKKKTNLNSQTDSNAVEKEENTDSGTDEEKKSKSSKNDEIIYNLLGQRPEKIAKLNDFQKRLIKLSLIQREDMKAEWAENKRQAINRVKKKHEKTFKDALIRGTKKGAFMKSIDRSSRSTTFDDSD